MRRWLALRLEAPLMAFGAIAVDHIGPVRDFPGASMLAGLIANALGWSYGDGAFLQSLQQRLVFGALLDREGSKLTDMQTALLSTTDSGWTTRGVPEGRASSTYAGPHLRRRDYLADAAVRIILRLEPEEDAPRIEDVAEALDFPMRPLFLGRKTCLPSAPLVDAGSSRWVQAATVHDALLAVSGRRECRASWPVGEGPEEAGHGAGMITDLPDRRNWLTGLHGGSRRVVEGRIAPRDIP